LPKIGLVNYGNLDILTLIIPQSDKHFESHPQQKRVLKEAMDKGVFIRVKTLVHLDVEFILFNEQGAPIIRDRRTTLEMEFVSPHFSPWDEIFDLQSDGTWKLKWNWRISDIDNICGGWDPSVSQISAN
jgi:hypothetical protein